MMDLKDIIKWFIPCFHIFLKLKLNKKNVLLYFFMLLNPSLGLTVKSDVVISENKLENVDITKNVAVNTLFNEVEEVSNQSVKFAGENIKGVASKSLDDVSVGRTFGRPFKKMMAGLLPVIFQIGAASTWAVVAALVGVKTLLVTMFILKILLIAGAAKMGALFASKSHHHEPPPQKEIHLHINVPHGHEQHQEEHVSYPSWSRDSSQISDPRIGIVYDMPYRAGPQTISTPFGNYVRVDAVTAPGTT